jgi:hypothetical protein
LSEEEKLWKNADGLEDDGECPEELVLRVSMLASH